MFFLKFNKIVREQNRRLQMSYLVQFGILVRKVIGFRLASSNAPLGDVVIHKHNSLTMRKETPRWPYRIFPE